MKAYVAVQKKLLIIIYTLWKKNETFNADQLTNTSRNEETAPSFANPTAQNEVAPA